MALKKREPMENLKVFSYTYLFFAVLGLIAAIAILLIPSISEAARPYVSGDLDPKTYLVVSVCMSAIGYLWYYWLVGRYVKGKSKGNVYMVLLIIGLIGGLVGIFTGAKGTSVTNVALDAAGLYLLFKTKNEDK